MLPFFLDAQATGPAPLVWVDPRGDTMSGPTAAERVAQEALRLSLQGEFFAHDKDRAYGTACSDFGENAGRATGLSPFPSQRALGVRLLPGLTLGGFSRMGCATSASIGGGFVFTKQVAPNIALSLGGGLNFVPNVEGVKPIAPAAQAGVVFSRANGLPVMVGITGLLAGPRLNISGLW